ncbi:mixed-linked glucanase [Dactylonectria estremocensis]|uniref:Mixed-linked glucanase n=1 Tax=Dactylonectria estremocensis TaxID=1079267 RepID=A0A9P9DAL7_9HYPO|nr:mixed-linked glucanase [Dactylonectria estremocensis]
MLVVPSLLEAVIDAVYILETNYDSSNLFREFGFFDGPDPTHGRNSQCSNIVTLHTSPGQITSNFVIYGNGFNQNGGGVYALEWTSSHISVWFFSRRDVPVDITNQEPNPPTWDQPAARFNGNTGCSIDAHFCNNNLVFDTTFSVAGGKARVEFVATNPFEFIEAYWLIASIRIYQQDDANQGAAGNYSSPGTYLSP